MNTDHNTALITVTVKGLNLAKQLQKKLGTGDIYTTAKLAEEGHYVLNPSLKEKMGDLFKAYSSLVFIMAAGITVRMIAPYLEDKLKDPAVLVMDELGQNVISLLSGHMGGANEMTLKVSQLIGAHPVITTATDVNNKAALDNIAKMLDASITDFKLAVKEVNSLLGQGEKVGIYMEMPYKIDTRGFTILESLENLEEYKKVVCITYKKDLGTSDQKIIKVVPKDLVLGIGCRKDTSEWFMKASFNDFLEKHNIDIRAIKCLASIEVKAHEKAIIALAEKLGVSFHTLPREEIAKVHDLFEKSDFVKKTIGVWNVAEPSAYLLSGGHLWINKHKYQGITFAIGRIQK